MLNEYRQGTRQRAIRTKRALIAGVGVGTAGVVGTEIALHRLKKVRTAIKLGQEAHARGMKVAFNLPKMERHVRTSTKLLNASTAATLGGPAVVAATILAAVIGQGRAKRKYDARARQRAEGVWGR